MNYLLLIVGIYHGLTSFSFLLHWYPPIPWKKDLNHQLSLILIFNIFNVFSQKFFRTFQNFSRTQTDFSMALKFTLLVTLHFQDLNVNSPYCLQYIYTFCISLTDFHKFPGPVALKNYKNYKTPGLSRFLRTLTHSVVMQLWLSINLYWINVFAIMEWPEEPSH